MSASIVNVSEPVLNPEILDIKKIHDFNIISKVTSKFFVKIFISILLNYFFINDIYKLIITNCTRHDI